MREIRDLYPFTAAIGAIGLAFVVLLRATTGRWIR